MLKIGLVFHFVGYYPSLLRQIHTLCLPVFFRWSYTLMDLVFVFFLYYSPFAKSQCVRTLLMLLTALLDLCRFSLGTVLRVCICINVKTDSDFAIFTCYSQLHWANIVYCWYIEVLACRRRQRQRKKIVDFHMKFDIINGINRLNTYLSDLEIVRYWMTSTATASSSLSTDK